MKVDTKIYCQRRQPICGRKNEVIVRWINCNLPKN